MAERNVIFSIRDILFEYDEKKNFDNIKKHGISFKSAARVFFDYDRIEIFDEENSIDEDRYDTIGRINLVNGNYTLGKASDDDILFVVYTERIVLIDGETEKEAIRMISARFATDFERGVYYGKN